MPSRVMATVLPLAERASENSVDLVRRQIWRRIGDHGHAVVHQLAAVGELDVVEAQKVADLVREGSTRCHPLRKGRGRLAFRMPARIVIKQNGTDGVCTI